MTANVARVTLTGYIMYFVNPQYASGTYHTLEGLLMMGFGLSLLRAECWVLDQVVDLARSSADDAHAESPPDARGPARTRLRRSRTSRRVNRPSDRPIDSDPAQGRPERPARTTS